MIKKTRKSDRGLYEDCEDLPTPALQAEQKKDIDSIEVLRHIMEICDMQIAKFMKLICNAQQAPGGLIVTGTSEKKEETLGIQRGIESDFKENQIVTNTMASYELILRYNNEIEKAKHEKLRCIELLIKMTPQNTETTDDGFIQALTSAVKDTWEEGAEEATSKEESTEDKNREAVTALENEGGLI